MNLYLQHLEEELKKDLEMLKGYEDDRRYARDSQERRRYSNDIQKLKQQISEREAEIQSLKEGSLSPQALIEHYLQADSSELEPADIRKIEKALQSNTLDASTLAQGFILLRKEKGLDLVINQLDWIYELACIADGSKPRYFLPSPKPTGRLASTAWMEALLKQGLPEDYSSRIAMTLGAFGVFIPEMIRPLTFLFTNPQYTEAERDEALIYLAMIDIPQAAPIIILAADLILKNNNPQDEYYPGRGLLGLLLLDDISILAEQMLKNPPDTYMFPYAYGLAGSRNPRGRVFLERMRSHSNERVRTAIENALTKSWRSVPRSSTLFFERCTEKAIKVFMLAQEESRRLKHNFLGTEQILLGLIGEGTGIAATTLKLNKVNLKDARVEVEKIIGYGSDRVAKEIPFTQIAKRLLELSTIEADQLGHRYVGTEHLLLGLIGTGDGIGVQALKNLGVNLQKLEREILQSIAS